MSALVRYDKARLAVRECSTIDEGKDIADKALALQHYARQHKDPEMASWLAEIRLRAKRRIGELSADLERAAGANQHFPNDGKKRKGEALRAAGLSTSEAHRCEQIATVPEEDFERVIAEKRQCGVEISADDVVRYVVKRRKQDAPKARTEQLKDRQTVNDLTELAVRNAQFGTIYADPPWRYGNQSTRGATGDHYIGMTTEEICALPIAALAAKDAHLHIWTTNAFLFDAKNVLEAWGFEYKSCYIWVKPQIGMGNYWRVSHEFLLLGIRGSAPFSDKSLRSWGEFPRREHSAKPEEIRTLIQRASPGPRLELFARRTAPGWYSWGNEISKTVFDVPEPERAEI